MPICPSFLFQSSTMAALWKFELTLVGQAAGTRSRDKGEKGDLSRRPLDLYGGPTTETNLFTEKWLTMLLVSLLYTTQKGPCWSLWVPNDLSLSGPIQQEQFFKAAVSISISSLKLSYTHFTENTIVQKQENNSSKTICRNNFSNYTHPEHSPNKLASL